MAQRLRAAGVVGPVLALPHARQASKQERGRTPTKGSLELRYRDCRSLFQSCPGLSCWLLLLLKGGTQSQPQGQQGGSFWRGTKDFALESAPMRPGRALKVRAGGSSPNSRLRPFRTGGNDPFRRRPQSSFHHSDGEGGAWARVHDLWTLPRRSEAKRRERERWASSTERARGSAPSPSP